MRKVSVRRIWGWTTVGMVVLWVMYRLRVGWPSPLSEQWLFYVVSAALLSLVSLMLAWWPISHVVRVYQEQADARRQG
jgi:hypothetical protein